MRFLMAAATAALLAAASPAQAEMKSALTGEEIAAIVKAAGLPAELTADSSGAPGVIGQAGDVNFVVRALGCAGEPAACSTLMFFANFSLGRALTPRDYEILNSYNDSHLYGRAYALPNSQEVGIDYVIELDGGVSPEHLAANVGRWADVIGAFLERFRAASAQS